MKYIRQFTIILFLSLAGEILHLFVPLPVPASIYGLLIPLFGLKTKWIPLEAVEEASTFLIDIMPLMFIPAAVGLLDSWGVLRPILIPFLVITGKVTQFFIKSNRNRKAEKDEQCSK